MRSAPLILMLLAAGCHGASRSPDASHALRVAKIDSATARRICQSPDSVIAGTKDCVLLDQGRRPREFAPPPPPRRQ
ncbi:MAG: hypothetical protein ACJ79A_11860 [Gemmatimonadaceae bacterium]